MACQMLFIILHNRHAGLDAKKVRPNGYRQCLLLAMLASAVILSTTPIIVDVVLWFISGRRSLTGAFLARLMLES
jgi:hypothetical protein